MGPRRPPDQLERVIELEAVPLSHDPLGLLDRHTRLQGVLELRTSFVRELGHREEPTERSGRLRNGAGAHGLELPSLSLFAHRGDSKHRHGARDAAEGPSRLTPGPKLDHKLAVKRIGNSK